MNPGKCRVADVCGFRQLGNVIISAGLKGNFADSESLPARDGILVNALKSRVWLYDKDSSLRGNKCFVCRLLWWRHCLLEGLHDLNSDIAFAYTFHVAVPVKDLWGVVYRIPTVAIVFKSFYPEQNIYKSWSQKLKLLPLSVSIALHPLDYRLVTFIVGTRPHFIVSTFWEEKLAWRSRYKLFPPSNYWFL